MEMHKSKVQYKFDCVEEGIIDKEINNLLRMKVISIEDENSDKVLSPIFLRAKKNGEYRMVLNLKKVNECIPYKHFKMETFERTLELVTPGCWMASVDLRHAYYSIKLAEEQRKYFCFTWKGIIYQFTCMPNGVSEGPRIFTKLLKPVYAKLRNGGFVNSGFIDDSILMGDTSQECSSNVNTTTSLMTTVGFIINDDKSVLTPCTKLTYLGNIIDSMNMIVTLTIERQEKIRKTCKELLGKSQTSIRHLARIIGMLVAAFSAVELGKMHYRILEINKIQALRKQFGNYDGIVSISADMKKELHWWTDNVHTQFRRINRSNPTVVLETDASLLGWGAILGSSRTGGRWTASEQLNHINCLELMAIFNGLRAFKSKLRGQHIKILCDNSTAVNYINSMGGTVSHTCNGVSLSIWQWCIQNEIWLTCSHIAGSLNVEADKESRVFRDNLEWKLDEHIFKQLCHKWGTPDIDLFASRLNAQVARFCSWKPDPECELVDAFSMAWGSINCFYAFPPFSLLGRCVQKVRQDMAKGIIVAPLWPTQPWFTRLMEILVDVPIIILKRKGLLTLPHLKVIHPLEQKLKLIVCKVSGKTSDVEDFLKNLPTFSCNHGNLELRNSTTHISKGGFNTVVKGKFLQFYQSWKQ